MVIMARQDPPKAVRGFQEALGELTFNSKPLIDDLTRAAAENKSHAPKIVEIIESRLIQARPDWKLPSLYLLDSIMKNLRSDYMEEITKVLVSVFCHCFEKLVEPEPRKALYKLRLTWTPFVPKRKLAAIDRHVHALDPNWPLLATEPSSPTIFVNPKFLDGSSDPGAKVKQPSPPLKRKSTVAAAGKPIKVERNMKRIPKISRSKSPSSSPEKTVSVEGDKNNNEASSLSIRDRRMQILKRVKTDKIAMSLSAASADDKAAGKSIKRSLSPTPVSKRRKAGSKSPQRPRSTSPSMAMMGEDGTHKNKKRNKNLKVSFAIPEKRIREIEGTPPPEKRLKLEGTVDPVELEKPIPIKKAHLKLDDVPPELLPKHQERIKKQVEEHLCSGHLSSEQHETIVQQLDKLYQLELQKKTKSDDDESSSPRDEYCAELEPRPHPDGVQTHFRRGVDPRTGTDVPPGHALPGSGRSEHFMEPERGGFRGERERMPRGRDMRPPPPHHLLPAPFEPYPPNERGFPPPPLPHGGPPPPEYYRGRHPRDRRGDFRRPRGRDWMDRGRGRYFNGPPRGRGRALPGPPPPHWHEPPMDINGPPLPIHGPPPPPARLPAGGPPPTMPPSDGEQNVTALLSKLVDAGLIGGGGEESATPPTSQPPTEGVVVPPTHPRQTSPPLSVPTLSLTPATLEQFKSESAEDYRHHLDWHYQMNRKEKEGSARTARNWFMHPEDWLSFEELAHDSAEKELTLQPELPDKDFREISEQPSEQEQISCRVLPGETSDEVCSICQEPLEQFWEENDEEWHFKDAMRNDSGKLFHVFCYRDAKESGALDNSGSQLPSPMEVKGENAVISA